MTYCIVNESAGYIYLNIAKAGCTSIKTAIAEQLDVEFEVLQWDRRYRRPASFAYCRPDLFRFTCVRHPAARLVSCWADWCCEPFPPMGNYAKNPEFRVLRGIAFAEFVRHCCEQVDGMRNHHYAMQWRQLHVGEHICVDVIFKLEDAAEQWPKLQERFGLPPLQQLRTSHHGPWREYYDADLRTMVMRAYHEDFANLGYEW